MLSLNIIHDAQHYLNKHQLNGWLIYDYHHSNPVFWQLFGNVNMVTRPCFFFMPSTGKPCLLVHHVDAGRFNEADLDMHIYLNRDTMVKALARIVSPGSKVAMEYSPIASIPKASKVDAGTLELIRTLGVEIISSSDLLQYATQRWNEIQLHSHMRSAQALGQIALEAFKYVGAYLEHRPTEYDVAERIRHHFFENGLITSDGPIVAINEHCSDPHYQPQSNNSSIIRKGDWLLIDLWAKENTEASVYADIT